MIKDTSPLPQLPIPHKLTGLLQQAGEVLSDMRREHESAADALVSIAVALDGELDALDALPSGSPTQLQLCGLPALQPGHLIPFMGYPSARVGGRSPLDAELLADGEEVGVEEKVEWLHRGQQDAAGTGPSHTSESAKVQLPSVVSGLQAYTHFDLLFYGSVTSFILICSFTCSLMACTMLQLHCTAAPPQSVTTDGYKSLRSSVDGVHRTRVKWNA